MSPGSYREIEALRYELEGSDFLLTAMHGAGAGAEAHRILREGGIEQLRELRGLVAVALALRDDRIAALEASNARLASENAALQAEGARRLLADAVRASRWLDEHRPHDPITLLLAEALCSLDLLAIKQAYAACPASAQVTE